MKRLILAALLVPVMAHGQDRAPRTANLMYLFDADSTSVTYCRLEGANGAVWDAGAISNSVKVKTTGSSTHVTAVTPGTGPFTLVSAGDVIRSGIPGATPDLRVVVVRTDADNVILDDLVNWATDAQGNTGRTWSWYKHRCGTGATDGWVDVTGATLKDFSVQFDQGDIDGLEWRLECRWANLNPQPEVVFPGIATDCGDNGSVASGYCRFAAATAGIAGRYSVRDENAFSACRVGFKVQSADALDTGAELVTNGTFTGNANGWTLGGGGGAPDWAYAANAVSHADAGGTDPLTPTTPITIVAGHTYTVAFTVSAYAAGTLTATVGGVAGTAVSADGAVSQNITATTTGNLLLTPTTTFVGTVDGVSVVEVGITNLEKVSASITAGRY